MKDEESDEEDVGSVGRRGSSKKDEDFVWEEDQCGADDEPSSKKGRGRKKKSVVWNDNDCRQGCRICGSLAAGLPGTFFLAGTFLMN